MTSANKFFIIVLLCALFTTSCQKDSPLPDSLNELEFFCPVGEAESYFRGKMEGQWVCYKQGINHYQLLVGIASSFTTEGPTATVGSGQESQSNFSARGNIWLLPRKTFPGGTVIPAHKPSLAIQTPAEGEGWTVAKFFETYFSEEGTLPLGTPSEKGYNIEFKYSSYDTGGIFTSNGGNQRDSYLELTKCKKTSLPSGTRYELEFEFSCRLYCHLFGSDYPNKVYYTTIENGTFVAVAHISEDQ